MLARTLFATYPKRAVLGASLMITQSFLYNAIFFTYTLVLTKIYGVGQLDGLLLHVLRGREPSRPAASRPPLRHHRPAKMIAGTYSSPGLLTISAIMFKAGDLDAVTQTICWCVIFFFASAGADAAYLTVSEIFPVEVRAKAIAVFFAIAQASVRSDPGSTGSSSAMARPLRPFIGYLIGAGVMIVGAVRGARPRRRGRGQSLKDVALPLGLSSAPSPHLSNVTGAPRPPAARSVVDLPPRPK